jgi:RimJ/RimL family protein N-acetyltransferase
VIIETDRLLVRAMTPDEAQAIATEERAGQPWAPDFPTPGDVRIAAFALAGKTAFPTDAMPWGLFVIVEKSSGSFIGGIGFKSAPDERGEVEIGYGISDSFQGRGLATEAMTAVCEFARLHSVVVIAETDRDNVASQRVLEKSGLHSENQSDELIRWRTR